MTRHEIEYGVEEQKEKAEVEVEVEEKMKERPQKRNLIEVKKAEKNKKYIDDVKYDDFDDEVKNVKTTASITKEDYFRMLRQYAMSHTRVREKGETGYKEVEGESDKDINRIFWLDENLDPATGKSYRVCRVKRVPYFSTYSAVSA